MRAASSGVVRAARRAHRWTVSRRAADPLADALAEPPARLDLWLLHRRGARHRHGAALRLCSRTRRRSRGQAAFRARGTRRCADDLESAAVASRRGRLCRRTPNPGARRGARTLAAGCGGKRRGERGRRLGYRERPLARGGRARWELRDRRQGHWRAGRPPEPTHFGRRPRRRIHLLLCRTHRGIGRRQRDSRRVRRGRPRDRDRRPRAPFAGAPS